MVTEKEALEELIRTNRILVNYRTSAEDLAVLIENVKYSLKAYDNARAKKEEAREARKELTRKRRIDERISRIYGRTN